ncbi:MAG TPA: EpsI family protein [Candidatus Solibacter sp.]|nr:EpsI family protein [Candidatus Solibacter sp.]
MSILQSKAARMLSIVLVVQFAMFYAVAMRSETVPPVGPLSEFPREVPGWHMFQDNKIEPEVQEILKADDLLSRSYVDGKGRGAFLFVAFFKTQREGQSPHSPKNCLPGSGFEPIESFPIDIQIPGRQDPIHINRYLTARGEEKSVTLYWYQSRDRIIASEFAAKFWLIADSIRYRRSDCSLVRVVVPVRSDDVATADQTSIEFARSVFPALLRQLPM